MPKTPAVEFQGYSSAKDYADTPINIIRDMSNMLIENGCLTKTKPLSKSTNSAYTNKFLDIFEYIYSQFVLSYFVFKDRGGSNDYKYIDGESINTSIATTLTTVPTMSSNGNDVKKARSNANIIYLCDGTVPGRKFFRDGTDIRLYKNGLPAPTSAPTLSVPSAFAGSLNGDYYYYYTWVQTNEHQTIESEASPISAVQAVTLTTCPIRITIPATPTSTASGYITKARVYRLDPANTIAYYITEVTVSGSGTTVVDDYGNNSGHGYTRDFTRPKPVGENTQINFNPYHIAWYKQRMWYSKLQSNEIYFSEVLRPDAVKNDTSYLVIGDKDDAIKSLISTPQFLLVVKRKTMWIVEGSNPSDFLVTQVCRYGSQTEHVCWYQGYLYYANESGIFRTRLAGEPEKISDQILNDFRTALDASTRPRVENWKFLVEPTSNMIWISINSSGATANLPTITYIFNPSIGKFVGVINVGIESWGIFYSSNNTPKLFFTVADGYIYLYNVTTLEGISNYTGGYSEITQDISATIGGFIDPYPIAMKLYRLLKLMYKTDGQTETIDVGARKIDGTAITVKSNLSLGSGANALMTVGRSDKALSFKISKTAADMTKRWLINFTEIEYEPTTTW